MRDAMSFETHIRQSARGVRALAARAKDGEAAIAPRWRRRPSRSPSLPADCRSTTSPTASRWSDRTDGALAALQQVMDYELEIGIVTRRTPRQHSRRPRPARISSATRSSTISPRATGRAWRCRAGSARPRARASTAATCWAPGSSRPTNSATPRRSASRCGSTARRARSGETATCCSPFAELIAYASQDETIHAGEFFGSGTVGNCCGLEIGRFLESGERSSCTSKASACCATGSSADRGSRSDTRRTHAPPHRSTFPSRWRTTLPPISAPGPRDRLCRSRAEPAAACSPSFPAWKRGPAGRRGLGGREVHAHRRTTARISTRPGTSIRP